MSIGTTLKAARERSGLTIAQVAEQTRMIHQLVEDIEQDDFHRIIAAVYGRGFIKLFAECVGENPAPLVQEFNEIYSGARRPAVRTRPVQTASEEPDTVEAADAAPHRPKVRAVTVADDEPSPTPAPKASGRDAPTARPQPTPKPVQDEPEAPGRALSPRAPQPAPAPAQDEPEASGRDAPTARPQPAQAPVQDEPEAPGRDAPTARPQPAPTPAPAEPEVPGRALSPRAPQPAPEPVPKVVPPPRQGVKPVAAEVKQPPKLKAMDYSVPENEEDGLGELFDLGNRAKAESRAEKSASNGDSKGEGTKLRFPLTQQAPSWDDAPLSEGDFWQKLSNLDKWKYWKPAAAIAGLCLLSVLVLAIVSGRGDRPQGAGDVTAAPQPVLSEKAAEPAAAPAAAPNAGGKSVFTENLVPPPDSYVD